MLTGAAHQILERADKSSGKTKRWSCIDALNN
jgi:hypothetical protein